MTWLHRNSQCQSAPQSAIRVFDAHVPLEQAPQLERPEVDIPDPVVDLLEPNVFANADGGHVDPAAIPSNAAVGADVADFEPIGTFQSEQLRRHFSDRGRVARPQPPARLLSKRYRWCELAADKNSCQEDESGGRDGPQIRSGLRHDGCGQSVTAPITRTCRAVRCRS